VSVLDSVNAMLASEQQYGVWRRWVALTTASGGTAPTATAGGPTQGKRYPNLVTVPSMVAGVLGMYLTQCRCNNMNSQNGEHLIVALEYELGRIDLSTGTFTAGVAMPTKRYSARPAVVSSSQFIALVPTTTLTATTPSIGLTYTNQDGTGSRAASLVLPTNAVAGGVYMLQQALQAGDTGVRSVSAMTKSAGTVGIVRCFGYLLLAAGGQVESVLEPGRQNFPRWLLETGDTVTALDLGTRTTTIGSLSLAGVAET
jgi:hypothetical protein